MLKRLEEKDALYATFYEEAVPHLDALYVMARRLTRNPNDAEDLVQDTMLKAFRYFGKYQNGTNCKAWLFKILTNAFINRYHKKRSSRELLAFDEERSVEDRTAAPAQDPMLAQIDGEDHMYFKFFGDEVKRALELVPEDYRVVVLLADLQDFAYKDIADILDVPMGTVMSRLHRGRKMLQARLVDYARKEGIVSEEVAHNVMSLNTYRKKSA